MRFIKLLCRHYKQCGNEAKWCDTNINAYYCDKCKKKEQKAARAELKSIPFVDWAK